MFAKATAFNSDISQWKVGNVTDTSYMFAEATVFNSDISQWDVGNVTNMTSMFYGATAFNQNLSSWMATNTTTAYFMFCGCPMYGRLEWYPQFSGTPIGYPLYGCDQGPYLVTMSTDGTAGSTATINFNGTSYTDISVPDGEYPIAATVPAGYLFNGWIGATVTTPSLENASVIINGSNETVQATYTASVRTYSVILTADNIVGARADISYNGISDTSANVPNGLYDILATVPLGYIFSSWQIISGTGIIASLSSESTTLTVTNSAVTVNASYNQPPQIWPMYKLNAQHTSQSPYLGTQIQPAAPTWKFDTSGSIGFSSPAIGFDGTLYFCSGGSGDGNLYAIYPNGQQKWSYFIGLGARSPAIGSDGSIYIGSIENGTKSVLYALNAIGTIKWKFDFVNQTFFPMISPTPTIGSDGTIYCVGVTDTRGGISLVALDPNDGSVKWSGPVYIGNLGPNPSIEVALDLSGTVYVCTLNNIIAYTAPTTGTAGIFKFNITSIVVGRISSVAIGSDKTIYVGGSGKILAFNPDGTPKWSYTFNSSNVLTTTPSIGYDGTVYVGSADRSLYAITDVGTAGILKWSYATGGSIVASSPTIGSDGTVYVGSANFSLYAITAPTNGSTTGVLKWSYATGGNIQSSPAIGPDGTVYVGSNDKSLYAFTPTIGPAPMLLVTDISLNPDNTVPDVLLAPIFIVPVPDRSVFIGVTGTGNAAYSINDGPQVPFTPPYSINIVYKSIYNPGDIVPSRLRIYSDTGFTKVAASQTGVSAVSFYNLLEPMTDLQLCPLPESGGGNEDIVPNSISSIDISKLTNLIHLYCSGNNLSNINVSQNILLKTILCDSNNLSALDVTRNTALVDLRFSGNQLQSINVTQNTALIILYCENNNLSALDVTGNNALRDLQCGANQLQSLDVTHNMALEILYCENNNLSTLVTRNTALIDLRCYENQLQSLDVTENKALRDLQCGANQLQSLNVSQNTALGYLGCSVNQLQSLNVTQNTALIILDCENNNLSALDVTQNTALLELGCSVNQLQSLDVTQNTTLTSLSCSNNNIDQTNADTIVAQLVAHNISSGTLIILEQKTGMLSADGWTSLSQCLGWTIS